ncbi:hypothetical protein Pgy4_26920, partial [Pseudomonas savastanoi pv. glycinea str. race 4]
HLKAVRLLPLLTPTPLYVAPVGQCLPVMRPSAISLNNSLKIL